MLLHQVDPPEDEEKTEDVEEPSDEESSDEEPSDE